MKRIKYNLITLISVRHKVQIFTGFRRNNICKEHIRRNSFVSRLFPFRKSIIQLKFLAFYPACCHIAEQSVFKAVEKCFSTVRLRIAYDRLVCLAVHRMPYLSVFLVNHIVKPVFTHIVQVTIIGINSLVYMFRILFLS